MDFWDEIETEPEPGATVGCDHDCGALVDPQTVEELRAAVEHYRYHSLMSGCGRCGS